MPIEIKSLSPETQGALPLWIQRVIAWANRECDIVKYDITDYQSSIPEINEQIDQNEKKIMKILLFSGAIGGAVGILANTVWEVPAETSWMIGLVTMVVSMVTLALRSKTEIEKLETQSQSEKTTDTHHEITLASLSLEERAMLGEAISRASN